MKYHRDKNGIEIKYASRVYHDDGTVFEPFGTGMAMPGDGDCLPCWRYGSDYPIVWVPTKNLSVSSPVVEVISGASTGWYSVAVIAICVGLFLIHVLI